MPRKGEKLSDEMKAKMKAGKEKMMKAKEVKEVKKEVKGVVKEEAKVIEKVHSLKELKSNLRRLRASYCPPISKMKKADIAQEVHRLEKAGEVHVSHEPEKKK